MERVIQMIAFESLVTSIHSSVAHNWLVLHQRKQVMPKLGFASSRVPQNSFFYLQVREVNGERVGHTINTQLKTKGNWHPDRVDVPLAPGDYLVGCIATKQLVD